MANVGEKQKVKPINIHVRCEFCGDEFLTPVARAGSNIKCPQCNNDFVCRSVPTSKIFVTNTIEPELTAYAMAKLVLVIAVGILLANFIARIL
jgi:ribosomal protein S27E